VEVVFVLDWHRKESWKLLDRQYPDYLQERMVLVDLDLLLRLLHPNSQMPPQWNFDALIDWWVVVGKYVQRLPSLLRTHRRRPVGVSTEKERIERAVVVSSPRFVSAISK
jgi:hypothetical protein